ncbi:MAG: hypothetical protein KDA36_07350 [Planctomycetaceae bacterium]|nr:hypothetical protein [Planctomycetaceae bacterium]
MFGEESRRSFAVKVMDYEFRPLGKVCAGTGQPLQPGGVCFSVLVQKGDELERRDFSPAGWKGPPENTVAQWKCTVPAPVETKKKLVDPDAMMALFDRMTEEGNPLDEKLRYILSILLIRMKRLKQESSRWEGENEFAQLISTQGEGTYEVRILQLEDNEMQELQESLNARLAVE